nr:hypothetical protein [Actinomycetota bacterium]
MGIQLVLADDWELRGDGSGDMRALQFATLRRITEIYERNGLRGSFNAEVMQQLAHRRLAGEHPELGELAAEWEDVVRGAHSRGHDFQLHVHPQWSRARYEDGRWSLDASWSMLDYPGDEVRSILREARDYLQSLLRAVNPSYRCVSYRSGSWALAPSEHTLPALAELGIVVDISMAEGLHYESPRLRIDYRGIDESFLPYYPRMDDARRVSPTPEPIVCMPTHSFRRPAAPRLIRRAAVELRRLRVPGSGALLRRYGRPNDVPVEPAGGEYSAWTVDGEGAAENPATDLASMSWAELRHVLRDARSRARATGWDDVPVVLENHTKDIGDFGPIERLAAALEAADDIEVITLTELAERLEAGRYPIRAGEP